MDSRALPRAEAEGKKKGKREDLVLAAACGHEGEEGRGLVFIGEGERRRRVKAAPGNYGGLVFSVSRVVVCDGWPLVARRKVFRSNKVRDLAGEKWRERKEGEEKAGEEEEKEEGWLRSKVGEGGVFPRERWV
ncbi:hypothetical protein HAX54_051283 [Datura stramonium]|uniref:Uncharacterized protein n=1 Tax=Datura stramonium TaxID=4076 RepID=A0ABS8SXF0_DATST|nr:hypothetical protein [Datura stramonium]